MRKIKFNALSLLVIGAYFVVRGTIGFSAVLMQSRFSLPGITQVFFTLGQIYFGAVLLYTLWRVRQTDALIKSFESQLKKEAKLCHIGEGNTREEHDQKRGLF
jgi:hypothetical protein